MAGTGKVKVVGSPIASINTIVMQTNDALLKDKRIRQAINAAIDPAGLVEAVAEGHAVPTSSPIPVSSRYHGAVQKQGQARNIPLARKLLAEAGYRGQPIKITTNSRFAAMQDVAVVAQAQAREAGINLEVEVVEFAAQLDRYLKGNYQMMVFNYAPQLDPLFVLDRFTGDKAKQSDRVWSNPQASELLQQLAQASTPAQRQPLFDQLHRLFVEDAPMVVWCSPTSLSAVSPRLKGYEPWAGRKPRLWGVEFSK
jgi:peptide/nickel transport system substrate-binding protein